LSKTEKSMSKKEVISFEEAVALKNSGMLQPRPEPGQFWYNAVGSLVEIIEKNGAFYHSQFSTVQTASAPYFF
jgi:hypothetical protein